MPITKSQLEKSALKLLKKHLALKVNEKVTVVTDRRSCPIFNAVCDAVKSTNASLTKIRITKKRTPSSPLPELAKTFNNSDIIIAITDKSISHSPETRIARKRHGARVISMVEVDEQLFQKAMQTDQKKIKTTGNRLIKKLEKSRTVKITTPSGTDIKVNIIRDAISIDDGDSTKKGSLNNLPYGEVTIAPINIADGTIAIDFSRINIQQEDHAKITLKKGKITGYSNKKAKSFVEYLKKTDPKATKVVELGIGINPAHKNLIGKIIHDEKILGSVHFGFGGFGNKRKCKIHEDIILLRPTLHLDSKIIIKDGRLLF